MIAEATEYLSLNTAETTYRNVECRTNTHETVTYTVIVCICYSAHGGDPTTSYMLMDFNINGQPATMREISARGLTREILLSWIHDQQCPEEDE